MGAMPLFLAACSSDDDYAPGPEVAPDCPVVYFSNSNSSIAEVDTDDPTITIALQRENTNGELTVPIVVESVTGDFNIPSTATFADGSANASFDITYTEYQAGMKLELGLPSEYVNPYLKVEGTSTISISLTQLIKVGTVTYGNTTYPTRFDDVTSSSIYSYEGINRFKWKNFLGSGTDLVFTVDTSNSGGEYDQNDLSKLKGDIIPLANYYKDDYGYHFVKDGNADDYEYITWTPDGQSEAVSSFYFYAYYNGSSYSYIDFDKGSYDCGYGYFWSAYVNGAGYENIYFYVYY